MPGKNDDGLYKHWLKDIPECCHFANLNVPKPPYANRLVIGATNAGVKKRRRTVMDSGAGRPMFDDDELYSPRSRRKVNADVVWGDGSTRTAAFEGDVGPLKGCINTGGALESNLMSVGSTIDSLQKKYNRKICMLFDEGSTYIFKDVNVVASKRKENRFTIKSNGTSNGLRAATRKPGSSEVYHVPLYGNEDPCYDRANDNRHRSTAAQSSALLTKVERIAAKVPAPKQTLVFDDNIPLPSANQSNMEAEIRRLHNCWGHPGPTVMRLMLLQSGTQRHRRLARKVYELNPICNFCLEGSSKAAAHTRS